MKVELKHMRNGIISCVLGFAAVSTVYSDGYRNPPPTAEGIGKSGANRVFVDDASAISYNPANLALQTNASLVVAATFARTENEYSFVPFVPSAESDGDWSVLPNLYYAQPVGEGGIVLGLGITTPYGQGISWDPNDFTNAAVITASSVPYEASIMLVNFSPTIAFQLGDAFSVGLGADIMYSELELDIVSGELAPFPVFATGEGDGWGIGGNVGLTWNATERQRVALTYRSRVDIDYEGDFSVPEASPLFDGPFETTVKYPNSFGLGYGIALTEDLRIEAMLEWVEWSVNDTQTVVTGPVPSEPLENSWEDTITFGFGGDWQFHENWVVRAGYAFIETPIPDETITPLLPDADRHAISFGAGYSIGGHAIDLAYTFSIYDDRTSTNPEAPGTYEIDSDLLGLTYSYSF